MWVIEQIGRPYESTSIRCCICNCVRRLTSAQAQTYPSRPITIVVPFSAGGPTDTLARILGERLKGLLGQTIIVENPTGAAGTIGTARVARSAPDGYTLILGHWQTHVVNGATFGSLPFDVMKDFEPISLVADCPVWFVGKASLPANNLKELIAWLKANNGKATVGIAGVGGGARRRRNLLPKEHRHQISVCTLPRRSAIGSGSGGRTD